MADEFVLAMKTQGAYWNVNGLIFQDLRNLFYLQLMELHTIVDAIAERVRGLDGFTISSFEEFFNNTRLEERPGEVPDLMNLLSDHEASIRHLHNDAQLCFEEYEDHDTYVVIAHFIELHEQMAWILRSYIEPKITPEESQGSFL
jgi:starvation-inducible DNA-binding protein